MAKITIDGKPLKEILKEQGIVIVPENCSRLILVDEEGKPVDFETVKTGLDITTDVDFTAKNDNVMKALGLPYGVFENSTYYGDKGVYLEEGDARYNVPKQEPKVSEEDITRTIETTSIYSKAKEVILNAQRRQVAYGLEKYPEPLNANTWSTVETIDHIIDESIDKLHYLVMLRERLLMDAEVHRPVPDLKKLMEEAREKEE